MTSIPTADYLERFSAALVSEIKADMGRRELSFRGLAVLLRQNPQYVTSRLGAGNPHTGKRVDLSVSDLIVIAGALGTDAWDLIQRARAVVGPTQYMQLPTTAAAIADDELKRRRAAAEDRESAPTPNLPKVAKRSVEKAGASEFDEGD